MVILLLALVPTTLVATITVWHIVRQIPAEECIWDYTQFHHPESTCEEILEAFDYLSERLRSQQVIDFMNDNNIVVHAAIPGHLGAGPVYVYIPVCSQRHLRLFREHIFNHTALVFRRSDPNMAWTLPSFICP